MTTTTATEYEVEQELGSSGTVAIETTETAVQLRGVPGTMARARLTGGPIEESFRVETGPGRLVIRPIRRFTFVRRRDLGVLELQVPMDADLDIESVSGSTIGLDLPLGARVRSTSGRISLSNVGGSVQAETVSGALEVHTDRVVRLGLRSVSGPIAVEAPAATAIEARSMSGSLTVAAQPMGEGPFRLESISGALLIRTDEPIRVLASSVSGEVRTALGPTVSSRGRGRLAVGGDGAIVEVRTVSGRIEVQPWGIGAREGSGTGDGPAPAPASGSSADGSPAPPGPAEALGGEQSEGSGPGDARLSILRAVERGELDVPEALRRLETLGGDASDA